MEDMSNEDINKYLTEAMGKEYGKDFQWLIDNRSWWWFGLLWEWATKQEWWYLFFDDILHEDTMPHLVGGCYQLKQDLINPTNFAKAIYEFLKEGE